MQKLSVAERIVDVLATCSQDPTQWPTELRAECALIHARFEALKLDAGADSAWRQARLEWVKSLLKRSGMIRLTYHFRDCPQPGI